MDFQIQDFINRKDERKDSAFTKLKLLVYGVRDAASIFRLFENQFKEEHYAYDNGNWSIDKNRLTPTEVLLPGGIVSKLHIRPDSPIEIFNENGRLFFKLNDKSLSDFTFLKRPHFWNYTTRNKIPTKNLAQMYGLNCLNFSIYSGCEFFDNGLGCRFCSVKNTVNRDDPVKIKKSPDDLADVCKIATEYDQFNYIIVTGGSYLNSDEEFDTHIKVLETIRYNLPWNGVIKGNVAMMPVKKLEKLRKIYELEVENPSFNIEVFPKENFSRICPGKDKYVGFDHIIESLLYLKEIYGSGKVWSNFVAGIIPLEDMKKGFKFMAENGIVPGANLYHAEVGSVIGKTLGNINEDYVLALYRYASELYYKYGYKPFFDAGVLRNSLANEAYEGLL